MLKTTDTERFIAQQLDGTFNAFEYDRFRQKAVPRDFIPDYARTIRDNIAPPISNAVLDSIITECCSILNITAQSLRAAQKTGPRSSHDQSILEARTAAMRVALRFSGASKPVIAAAFNRHHTMVADREIRKFNSRRVSALSQQIHKNLKAKGVL